MESEGFKPELEQEINPEKEENKETFPMPEEFIENLKERGLEDHAEAYKKVLEVAEAIQEAGGRALLVGGSVRDVFFDKASKDFDIEVYKMEAEKLEELAGQQGNVSDVGKAFGILKLPLGKGMDIDLSLPRTDSKISEGHKGFAVKTDPNMSIEDAARRRDFTMNALAADPLTGELFDNFGGVEDIKARRLKVTDPERFKDDPLRVLRALQFIGRFGLEVDKDSEEILREMAPLLKELPKERIGEEWKKLLLKSEKPSLGLAVGLDVGAYQEIHPQFQPMSDTPQEPDWHPEGDVWVHSLKSTDSAAEAVRRENLPDKQALVVLLAAICHDSGKPETTTIDLDEEVEKGLVDESRIRSVGHEQAGEKPTREFLASIGMDKETTEKVVKLVVNHMVPSMLYSSEITEGQTVKDGAIRRLAQRIHPATIRELVLVAEADHMGRGEFPDDPKIREDMIMPPDEYPAGEWLLERAHKLEVEDSKPAPLTMGRDWIRLGFKQGPGIGKAIQLSGDLRDDKNWTREQVFEAIDGIKDEDEAIAKLEERLEE